MLQQQQMRAADLRAYTLMCRLYVGSIPYELGEADIRPVRA